MEREFSLTLAGRRLFGSIARMVKSFGIGLLAGVALTGQALED